MRVRFSPEIDRLRVTLQRTSGSALLEHLRRAIEPFDAAVLVADDAGRYLAVNDRAVALTGYSRQEFESLAVADLTPPANHSFEPLLWQEFMERGTQRGAYVLRTRKGELVHVKYWAFANVAPGVHVSVLVPAATDERADA